MIYLSKYATFRIDENIQLANKLYFKTNKLNEKDKNLILRITNGDNYTKMLCDLLWVANMQDYPVDYNFKGDLEEAYSQLKSYNKNYFPIENFDKNSLTNLNLNIFNKRKKVLDHMKKLPPVAIRNMKEDIRKERSAQEFSEYEDQLESFLSGYEQLSNRPEKIRRAIVQKMFKNNITLDDVTDFMQDKFNLIGGTPYDRKMVNKIIKDDEKEYNSQLTLIYDENNVMVVQVEGPEGIKKIGSNSLWCFTYGENGWDTWYKYSTNDVAYVFINFKEKSDNEGFMYVLIKPLDYDEDYDEEPNYDNNGVNEDKLYNMLNESEYDPLYIINKLIGLEKAREILTFGHEPDEEEIEFLKKLKVIKSEMKFKGNKFDDAICSLELFPDKIQDDTIYMRSYNKKTFKERKGYLNVNFIKDYLAKLHNYDLFDN